ncbi:MAG: hypothetical protein R3Y21_00905 [Mycoplasmatota bacterium]
MKTIEEYVEMSKTKENISDGGSPAYIVNDNLVLVKYRGESKYGIARESAEAVMIAANNKNKQGVRTPIHHEVYRTIEGKYNVCYVLQERAKGRNLDTYRCSENDVVTQETLMQEFLNMPNSHLDKCILDICCIFNMGLELKPKNVFYDNNIDNGGFIFIDFLEGNEKELDFTKPKDINLLLLYLFFLKTPAIPNFGKLYTEEQKLNGEQFSLSMNTRIFKSLERVIPNFEIYKRDILRTYDQFKLNNLISNNVVFENLSLTEEEIILFGKKCKDIAILLIKGYLDGTMSLGDIYVNKIRIDSHFNFLDTNWTFNRLNILKTEDFEDYYDYKYKNNSMLEATIKLMIDEALETKDYNLTNINFYDFYKKICQSMKKKK